MASRKRRNQSGFTLIELLISVAIIGIIAVIAIPSMLDAIDRGKQKRTMGDIRSVSMAVETYSVDFSRYPRNVTTLTPVRTSVKTYLVPMILSTLPELDGWSRDILYQSSASGSAYTVRSYGKDSQYSSTSSGKTNDFDCDIVYQDGGFVAWPEGIQT